MSKISDKYIKYYSKMLSEEGRKLVIRAFESASFDKNKTQNLHDSYGSAVYYNGTLLNDSKYVFTSRATQGRFNTYTGEMEYGRYEINDFFNNYKPHTKGFELVVVAAMFYGQILESGKLRRKYKVISGINSDIGLLASKLKGSVIDINL